MAQGFPSRGLGALAQIDRLPSQSAAQPKAIQAMEVAGHANVGAGLTGMADTDIAAPMRLTGQGVLATMLELMS